MTEFNTKPIEEKLSKLGRELQSFFENIIPDNDLDVLNPRADFVQSADGFEIYIDLPGLTKQDVKVELTDNILTVKGQRDVLESADHVSWLRRERHYGRFSRSFPMPVNVNKCDIKATFSNGVLAVIVKADEASNGATSIDID